MARISKKKKEATVLDSGSLAKKVYSVGIYARLSVDGDKNACGQASKNESIETQIEITKAFVRQQEDMVVFGCYTDIGKTGTNFEREGFERMMCDVRMHKIDCIIVKDLSRFGRNYIETGNYIEKIFPFMGVRFIAVTDHFDSMDISGQSEALSINLKNLVNEMYAKDIAVKIKSSRREKWEQGSYTGGVPPYGYRAEWIGDKKCLFKEEVTSDIVKKIFDLFLSGKSLKEITIWLYEERIVRPSEYHQTGHIYRQQDCELLQWNRSTVKMILTNPVYMGCLVQGRTCGKNYGMRQRHAIEPEEWAVKEHTHEAIICEDIFWEAASKFETSSIYCNKKGFSKCVPTEEDVFADILYCGNCGVKMKRITSVKTFGSKDKIRLYSYNCPKYNRIDGRKCTTKSITLSTLTKIVKGAIRQEIALSAMHTKDLTKAGNREAKRIKKEDGDRLTDVERKIMYITQIGSEQYLKYRMGEMDESAFRRAREINHQKIAALQKERIDIIEGLKSVEVRPAQTNHFLSELVKKDGKTKLTSEAVRTLIHRIEVYPDHRIKVIFAFKRRSCFGEKESI